MPSVMVMVFTTHLLLVILLNIKQRLTGLLMVPFDFVNSVSISHSASSSSLLHSSA